MVGVLLVRRLVVRILMVGIVLVRRLVVGVVVVGSVLVGVLLVGLELVRVRLELATFSVTSAGRRSRSR
jgi:hypothetical protein